MEVSGGVGVVEKGEGVAGRLGDALVAPAFAADGYVAVVATDFHLCTLVYEVAVAKSYLFLNTSTVKIQLGLIWENACIEVLFLSHNL